MDKEEIKFILAAGHRSGRDAERPEMAEALEQAKRDPELRAWLERERASDAAIARKLQALQPPPGLRAQLIAGGRASRRGSAWRRWLPPLAIAAGVTLTIGLLLPALRPERETAVAAKPALQDWQESSLAFFSLPHHPLDVVNPEYPPLEAYLLGRGAQVVGQLPFNDGIRSVIGCKVLEWKGYTTSLTCFFSTSGELVHIFVLARGPVEESLIRSGAHRQRVGEYATVTWLEDDKVVMVASKLPASELNDVLKFGQPGKVAATSSRFVVPAPLADAA